MSKAGEAPHELSLAVWDLPSPLVMNRSSRMKAGARCSAGCSLTGKEIEIHDQMGARVASGRLGPTPFPGTSALYWAEVDMIAPSTDGPHSWTVRFIAEELELPHKEASSNFSFIAVKPPEHCVTIHVREEKTQTPVESVEVRLGVYRTATDETGLAQVDLPKGNYDLNVWKVGYEIFSRPIQVTSDVSVQVEVVVAVEPEQEYWK